MKRQWSLILVAAMLLGVLVGCGQTENNATTTTATTTAPTTTTAPVKTLQFTELDFAPETTLKYTEDASLADFDRYCDGLKAEGLAEAFNRDTESLRCGAYLNDETYTYAYYAKRTGEMRVIVGPKAEFAVGDFAEDTGVTAAPTLSMVGQKASKNNGQGFVFVLPDGRLILQDGGNWFDDIEPDLIYNALKTVAPDPENIVIAGWFISHPHSDHIGAFLKFVTDCSQDETIRIQRVICSFAGDSWYDFEREDGTVEDSGHYVLEMQQLCSENLPDTVVIKAHTGQVFDFGVAQVEILHTVEDILPAEDLGYINSSSMVIRVHVAEQKVLLLADTTSTTATTLIDMYEDALASDMVQLAHHGMWAGNEMLYFYTMSPVLLWPTQPGVAVDWLMDKPALSAIKQAEDIFVAGTGITTLELPHTVVGNKQDVLAELNALK